MDTCAENDLNGLLVMEEVMEEKTTQPIKQGSVYTFFEEYDVGSGGFVSKGFCIAVCDGMLSSCLSAAFDVPDSPVVYMSLSSDYIEQFCKEVTEKQARRIHPNLFRFLDQVNTS